MNYIEKAKQARENAAKKRAWAKQRRELADRSPEHRAGHLQAALDLETDAGVDEAFAATCERWAAEAA